MTSLKINANSETPVDMHDPICRYDLKCFLDGGYSFG
jgi:hypothetical protein